MIIRPGSGIIGTGKTVSGRSGRCAAGTGREDTVMTKTIMIGGMACAECAEKVKKALEAVPGVESVFSEQSAGIAVAETNGAVDDAALRAAVEGAGYSVFSIS